MTYNRDQLEQILELHRERPGATLPILHDVQRAWGHIPEEAIPVIAESLNLSRAEIYGVITFYADFRLERGGEHLLQVCRGEACQARGGEVIEAAAREILGCDFHETTADRKFSLEPVFCLGNCGCSPSVRLDDDVYGRVDRARLAEIVAERSGKGSVCR